MSKKSDKKHSSRGRSKSTARPIVIWSAVVAVLGGVILLLFLQRSTSDSNKEKASSAPNANANSNANREGSVKQAAFEVVNSFPHDPTSFTQGLLWYDGTLYESTGLNGESKLRRLEFPSGKVLKETPLAADLFGEGLALVNDRLIQLTWTTHRGFVYDRDSFRLLQEFRYETEGWGLAFDGARLILSDGSSDLFFYDPQTLKLQGKMAVTLNGEPIRELNELEFIEGEIWANVWQTDFIMRISPTTGQVTSFLNLKGILSPSDRKGSENVLNGIAYDAGKKRIFVTGKLWPRIFEIRLK